MQSDRAGVVLRDPSELPANLRGGAVAIGNFDGVHRGHRAVLEPTVALARQEGLPALALTFEPHPRSFFRPERPVFRLTPSQTKADLIAGIGFDATVELTFDATLAGLAPEDFVTRFLVRLLAARHIVVGHDFHYGKARGGTPAKLVEEGRRNGFEVVIVPPAGDGEILFSSSKVRALLAEGRVDGAASILGYDWFVRGPVQTGARRGRDLGFPTANVRLPDNCELRHGVYAVRVRVGADGYAGVASFGRRPQFDNGAPLLEVHIFDFSGDLYGRSIDVAFISFLRDEARFPSVEALIAQMEEDALQARRVLAGPDDAAGARTRAARSSERSR